jgi:predicted DNA-binding transcriptional regulator AlpA
MTFKNLLSHNEAAQALNIAAQTLYNWRHARKGPDYIKIGSKPMYRPEDIEEYINSNRIILSHNRRSVR